MDEVINDPLLEGEVNVKGYSDKLFAENISEQKQPEKIQNKEIEQPETETDITETDIDKGISEEKETLKSDIGKDYEGDGIESMMDEINKGAFSDENTDTDTDTDTEKPKITITKEQARSFSGLIGYILDQFVPPVFVGASSLLSGINEARIYEAVVLDKKLPEEFYHTFIQDREEFSESVKLKKEEIELIKDSFTDFAHEKQIKFANSTNKFIGSIGAVMLRLVQTTISHSARMNARWNRVFKKYGIE